MHNYDIKNKEGQILKDLATKNKIILPDNWENKWKMTIFDKAYFGIIPNRFGHKSDE